MTGSGWIRGRVAYSMTRKGRKGSKMKKHIGWATGLAAGILAIGGASAWAAAACGGVGKEAKAEGAACKGAACVAQAGAKAEVKAEAKAQTHCPVMNAPINRKLYVDHAGKRIYVCCGGCVARIKADPDKYIRQLEEKGVTLEAVPEVKTES